MMSRNDFFNNGDNGEIDDFGLAPNSTSGEEYTENKNSVSF